MDDLKVRARLEGASALREGVSQEATLSWGVPNQITVLRILLTPVYIILLVYELRVLALTIFFLVAVSDAVDGFVARRTGQITSLGTILDPLADKLLMIASFVSLSYLGVIPPWLTIVVVSRDVLLLLGTLVLKVFSGSVTLTPTLLGKWTTVMQLVTVFWALLFHFLKSRPPLLEPLLGLTTAATLASGLQYLYRAMRRSEDIP